jgi:hypothetical protein
MNGDGGNPLAAAAGPPPVALPPPVVDLHHGNLPEACMQLGVRPQLTPIWQGLAPRRRQAVYVIK